MAHQDQQHGQLQHELYPMVSVAGLLFAAGVGTATHKAGDVVVRTGLCCWTADGVLTCECATTPPDPWHRVSGIQPFPSVGVLQTVLVPPLLSLQVLEIRYLEFCIRSRTVFRAECQTRLTSCVRSLLYKHATPMSMKKHHVPVRWAVTPAVLHGKAFHPTSGCQRPTISFIVGLIDPRQQAWYHWYIMLQFFLCRPTNTTPRES